MLRVVIGWYSEFIDETEIFHGYSPCFVTLGASFMPLSYHCTTWTSRGTMPSAFGLGQPKAMQSLSV